MLEVLVRCYFADVRAALAKDGFLCSSECLAELRCAGRLFRGRQEKWVSVLLCMTSDTHVRRETSIKLEWNFNIYSYLIWNNTYRNNELDLLNRTE